MEENISVGALFSGLRISYVDAPFYNLDFRKAYAIFSRRAEKQGIQVYFANYKRFKKGKLTVSWNFHHGRWSKVRNQKIDIVYSRFARSLFARNKENKKAIKFKFDIADEINVINHPLIDKFCWDKKIISDILPEDTPKTFLVNTDSGARKVVGSIKTKKVVVKPRYGTLGKGVIITDKQWLPEIKKNTLIQEFIDTSNGIKNVVKGYHDLRVVIINGKIDHAHVRTPKKGLLVANVALGGKKMFIKKEQIPSKIISIVNKIDLMFEKYYPRIYSVDFLIDKSGKPFIVECNSQPMIDKYAFGKYADVSFYDRMCEAMKKIELKVVNVN